MRPLSRDFFSRDPRRVARALLGKLLVRDGGRPHRIARIVETEAYLGRGDAAAHAAAGCTARNEVLFGPPGHAYVYFIYGNHYCLNVSCEPEGKAGSVLIRALEPLEGMRAMARARGHAGRAWDLAWLTSGPGRLAQAFSITRTRDNGRDLTHSRSGLWLAQDDLAAPRVAITPRIGIIKAAERRLRYFVKGNAFVSGRRGG
jgi:DNA-3-methyladenine glycosylase